ncbi:MAG: hypothetical protein QOI21_1643 [Actinomycetota bacterium]|jgi:hypothetical protein|nr:hypothetical protein [Actinomycetota bacterium]
MTEEEAARAAYRAFVRKHHPDVGGDPDEFIAGLEKLRRTGPPEDRFDAPVMFVVNPKGIVGRVRRWRDRRRRPPRVQ